MKKHQNVAASKTENKTNIRETNIRKTSIRESNTRKNNLRKPVNRKASKKISISVFSIVILASGSARTGNDDGPFACVELFHFRTTHGDYRGTLGA